MDLFSRVPWARSMRGATAFLDRIAADITRPDDKYVLSARSRKKDMTSIIICFRVNTKKGNVLEQ